MTRYYYTYTRPNKSDSNYPDPDHALFEAEGLTIIETSFWRGRTYICYIGSDLTKINWVLNSCSEFNWKKSTLDALTQDCNDNIERWDTPFTNDGTEIIDNRVLSII